MNVISRLFNKSAGDAMVIDGQRVAIPKLTVGKWQELMGALESLPQLIVSVLGARHSEDFTTTALIGANLAADEIVRVIAILAELEPEFVKHHMSTYEMSEFIRRTVASNDMEATVKNFRAVFGMLRKKPEMGGNPTEI